MKESSVQGHDCDRVEGFVVHGLYFHVARKNPPTKYLTMFECLCVTFASL